MNIAVAADGKTLDSKVSEELKKCSYLLIVNMDNLNVKALKNDNSAEDSYGEDLAGEVLKYDCEAIITGKIEPKAFNILADACVTRYLGAGRSAQDALGLMEKNSLEFIKNYDGSEGCGGNH